MNIKEDAYSIINYAIKDNLPDEAVKKALKGKKFSCEKLIVIAVGKAAWRMADAASSILKDKISLGMVITKYGHSKGKIKNFKIYEAGHPVSDENTYKATSKVIKLVSNLNKNDQVLFLLSGGASALFELPLISKREYESINNQLLRCGANISEINTIRKRLSAVKGGRFADLCKPAKVSSIILSDVIGNRLDMIGSGPTCVDSSSYKDALRIVKKYNLKFSKKALEALKIELPNDLTNTNNKVIGSVSSLCLAAIKKAKKLGYEVVYLGDDITIEARKATKILINKAKEYKETNKSIAIIMGGETIVKVKGNGKGGRNQELVFAGIKALSGYKNVCLFSVGSDGTDGPTDAAGGYVDENSYHKLKQLGIKVKDVLDNNDSYNALASIDGLIKTGPTGTNVNDLSVLLIKR